MVEMVAEEGLLDKTVPQEKVRHEASYSTEAVLNQLKSRFSTAADQSIQSLLEAKVQGGQSSSAVVDVEKQQLFRKAHYDALTHLPNRAYFDEVLEALLISSHHEESHFSLLFLDLDGFKAVNDQLGHRMGDELLRHVAARLIFSLRDEDWVFRLGGDEFVALIPETSDKEVIEVVANRIISEVSRDYWLSGKPVKISTSVGVARFPEEGRSASELIEHADQALYVAKEQGKGRMVFYDANYVSPYQKFVAEVADLERAIEAAELVSCHCEQLDSASSALEMLQLSVCWKQQALTAWQDKLEKSRYADQVGLWLLDSGFYRLKSLDAAHCGKNCQRVSLPLLPYLLKRQDLVEKMEQFIAHHQVETHEVVLQSPILDWESMGEECQKTVKALSDVGFTFMLEGVDDENFRLSTLQSDSIYSIQLSADWVLKLKQKQDFEPLKTLIQMVHLLDKKVSLEEGVLEPSLLKELGVDWVKTLKLEG